MKATHGLSNSPLYVVWRGMMSRCSNPNNQAYCHYGGRGISVCLKWKSFQGFIDDMQHSYKSDLRIERIDNDGNYESDNCRWATLIEQGRNKRNNRRIELHGKMMTLSEANETLGFRRGIVTSRLNQGWTTERAITQPMREIRPRIKKENRGNTL